MAINFPDTPTNGQSYTDPGTGQTWTYELATNSWTASTLATTGGVVYKGSVDITAAPPTGAKAGEQWSIGTGGTANAGYGPGVTGAITKGSMVMYTGSGWLETNHTVPEATPATKGIDTRKWDRTGTVLSPATAGDVVNISAGTAALPGLTPVGDPNTGIYSPGADQVAVSTGGAQRVTVDASGRLLAGTTTAPTNVYPTTTAQTPSHVFDGNSNQVPFMVDNNSPSGNIVAFARRYTAAVDGTIARLLFSQHDGTNYRTAAQIAAMIDGPPGTADMPGRLVFSTTEPGSASPTQRMLIDSAGKVGIGTPTPGDGLSLGENLSAGFNAGNTGHVTRLRWRYGGTEQAWIERVNSDGSLAFGTQGSERARIDDTGRLLVGTSSGTEMLEVNGNTKTQQVFSETNAGYGTIASSGTWTTDIKQTQYQSGITYLVTVNASTFAGGVRKSRVFCGIVGFSNDSTGDAQLFATLATNGLTATAARVSGDVLRMTFTNTSGIDMRDIRVNFLKLAISG